MIPGCLPVFSACGEIPEPRRRSAPVATIAAVLQILAVTLPFFALIAAGYLAARRRVLPLEAIPGLNVFVLYFALPCMLYRFGAGTPLAQLFDGTVGLIWALSALCVVGVVIVFTRGGRIGWNDAAFGALVAAFPNTGFMGVPLLAAVLGSQAVGPVILTILFDMVLTSSVCIALSRLDGTGSDGASRAVRQALRGVVLNPLPWAMLLGALASYLRYQLPAPIERTIGMLADAASPAALFTIGAVLARSALHARQLQRRAPFGEIWVAVAAKLVLHPALVFGVGLAALALGLPLSTSALVTIVLVAALPSASNVSMLAERFGADNGRIARIILWTTVGAFFTFPLLTAWLH
ncbi:AEC family transporter [soil metagenome]